jgi:hypothetical protein
VKSPKYPSKIVPFVLNYPCNVILITKMLQTWFKTPPNYFDKVENMRGKCQMSLKIVGSNSKTNKRLSTFRVAFCCKIELDHKGIFGNPDGNLDRSSWPCAG